MLGSDMQLHMKRLKAKRKSSHDSGETANSEKLLPFYVRIMTKLADCERCSVFINDPDQDKVWLKAGTGVDEREIEVPKAGSFVGDVITAGTSRIITNLEIKSGAHKQVDEKTGFTTRNILCVPIKTSFHGKVSGAFQLLNKIDGQEFTSEDQSLAEEVADHLQDEIDAIFLDQEIFGLTERLYSSLAMVTKFFIASVVVIIVAVFGLLALWVAVPLSMG
jgi:GAF domain-containing protein